MFFHEEKCLSQKTIGLEDAKNNYPTLQLSKRKFGKM